MKKIGLDIGGVIFMLALAVSYRPEAAAIYAAAAILHETGHLIAARAMGIEIARVRFELFGARIDIKDPLLPYSKELVLALCGPLFSFLYAGIGALVLKYSGGNIEECATGALSLANGGGADALGMLCFFIQSNLAHGVINLLPVKGFDGGRALRCALARAVGERGADAVTDFCGAAVGTLAWIFALYLMIRISAGLGVFAFAAGIFAAVSKGGDGERANAPIWMSSAAKLQKKSK